MRLLLDTHTFLWHADGSPQMSAAATALLVDPANDRVRVQWREMDGPPVTPPLRRGFGHVVIEQIVPRALSGSGTLDFAPGGVNWTFEFPNRNA